MARKTGERTRVQVQLGTGFKSARSLLTGIFRYAATHPHIELSVVESSNPRYEFTELGDWRPDGFIGGRLWYAQRGKSSTRAAVFVHDDLGIAQWRMVPRACEIECDDEAAGRLAAAHFLRRNLRHVAFVGAVGGQQWSVRRGEAFAAAVAKAGLPAPAEFRVTPGATLAEEKAALGAWLRALPKPCGVFAAMDHRGKHVLDVCRENGIAVPELVQVLGVDNEEYICEQSVPPLSSVEPDFEAGGYEAMRMLDAMLSGDGADGEVFRYGIRGIVERHSTRDDRGTARIVNRALDFIRMHAATGATAADVVKAAGCSASLLQRCFRKALGRTVVGEIRRVRLERACELLRRTDTPIGDIAPLCGYGDAIHLKIIFRRAFGCSMREWRRKHRETPDE